MKKNYQNCKTLNHYFSIGENIDHSDPCCTMHTHILQMESVLLNTASQLHLNSKIVQTTLRPMFQYVSGGFSCLHQIHFQNHISATFFSVRCTNVTACSRFVFVRLPGLTSKMHKIEWSFCFERRSYSSVCIHGENYCNEIRENLRICKRLSITTSKTLWLSLDMGDAKRFNYRSLNESFWISFCCCCKLIIWLQYNFAEQRITWILSVSAHEFYAWMDDTYDIDRFKQLHSFLLWFKWTNGHYGEILSTSIHNFLLFLFRHSLLFQSFRFA